MRTNFCKDCKHSEYNGYGVMRCNKGAKPEELDPVTGEAKQAEQLPACWWLRESIWPWNCGKKGRFYERKE